MITTNDSLPIKILFEKFISDSEKGKRLQKNGKLISPSTLDNYKAVLINLSRFIIYSKKEWLFSIKYKYSEQNFEKQKRHYKKFYLGYTSFLYSKGCTDNYVGLQITIFRTFFIYMIDGIGYNMGQFYKDFYTRKDEIPVIVLGQEQLKFLIYDKEFENKLPDAIKTVKDIFVVGCAVGLRFSDLIALKSLNLENHNENFIL